MSESKDEKPRCEWGRRGPYRNDLHRLMSQPESWFTGHTPHWPEDGEPRTSITISVKITCDGRGLSRAEADKLCQRIERLATGRSQTRTVSAII